MPTSFPLGCTYPLGALIAAACLVGCANPAGGPVAGAATAGARTGPGAPVQGVDFLPGQAGAKADATAGASVAAPAAGAAADGTVLASASGVTLTRDNAEAFVDAFQFALAQINKPKTFTPAEREQLIQALAKDFANQPAASQQELAKARATWTATQAAWGATDPAEQQAFVSGVLSLAVGEQAAARLQGQVAADTGAAASGGGDPWAAEAKEKCENGSYEDQMFYCHGVQTPSVSPW